MTERDPRMLPGMTARAAWRIQLFSLTVVPFVAIGLFAWGGLTSPLGQEVVPSLVATFGPLAIAAVVIAGAVRLATTRERLELDAGYTTLTDQHDEVDQVDWRSGARIRLAVGPRPVPSGARITAGEGLQLIQVTQSAVGSAVRSPLTWIVTIAGLAIMTVSVRGAATALENDDPLVVAFLFSCLTGFLITFFAMAYGLSSIPQRSFVAVLRQAFPDATVSITQSTSDILRVRRELLPNDSFALRRPLMITYVVVRPDAVSLWFRRRRLLLPLLVLPRNRILSVTSGSDIDSVGHVAPAAILEVLGNDGRMTTLPIISGLSGASFDLPAFNGGRAAAAERLVRWYSTGAIS